MLDSVRTEENRRVVAAICTRFSLDSSLPIEKLPKGIQPKILGNAARASVPKKIVLIFQHTRSHMISLLSTVSLAGSYCKQSNVPSVAR